MLYDQLSKDLYAEICHIPIIDPHTHIDPRQPTARSLDDILGYHYYTELAHSAGMEKFPAGSDVHSRDRARSIVYHMSHFDNTAQYQWFLEIARAFLNFQGSQITLADCASLCDTAERLMSWPDWEERVLRQSNVEKVFLTNDFDDTLEGFDTERYIPCLRTDDLVFHLQEPEIRRRLAECTGIDIGDAGALRAALANRFEHFIRHGAKACAVSLPPDFIPAPAAEAALGAALRTKSASGSEPGIRATIAGGVFWLLAENCRTFKIPFDLMIGVNRKVYEHGVHQGQDLFDQRTSLIQYADAFNAFPEVSFCISTLSSGQNQELVSYSWIFPNVYTFGHWWYSNIPPYIAQDLRARMHAVPKLKQIGYYSDMYKLEFCLPKFNMYRRILAQVLADDYVRTRVYTQSQALELARFLLRNNVQRIFSV
jgi:glucuronate isomerase